MFGLHKETLTEWEIDKWERKKAKDGELAIHSQMDDETESIFGNRWRSR